MNFEERTHRAVRLVRDGDRAGLGELLRRDLTDVEWSKFQELGQ